MGDIVNLHGRSTPLEDDELIENLARFADGTLTAQAVKSRHHLSNEEWTALGENDALVEKIEIRKLLRIRGGQTKIERAQLEIIDAPPILGKLMRSPDTNARHVIDTVKVLNSLATGGGEAAAAGTRFEIFIDLSSGGEEHILHFNKSVEINADDTDPNETTDVIAAIATNKLKDDGGGQGHL